jgi:hypothetical protein
MIRLIKFYLKYDLFYLKYDSLNRSISKGYKSFVFISAFHNSEESIPCAGPGKNTAGGTV